MADAGITIPGVSDMQSELTWINVAIGLAFILFDIGVSSIFRLGVGISLLVSALRCIGQLAVVATILNQVFEKKNPWMVAMICCESSSFILFCRCSLVTQSYSTCWVHSKQVYPTSSGFDRI